MNTPLLVSEDGAALQPCVRNEGKRESAKYPSVGADSKCQAERCLVSCFASVIG